MHLARAVAAELLISSPRPPAADPSEPPAAGCRNGDRRMPLLDWLTARPRGRAVGPEA